MIGNQQQSKILFIDSGAGYGGSSAFLYTLLKYLNREKFKPLVGFYFYNNGSNTEKIRSLGVPVFFLNGKPEPSDYVPVRWLLGKSRSKLFHQIKVILRFLLRMVMFEILAIIRLRKLIKRQSISLVVLNNDVHYHVAGAFGAKLARIPVICRKAGGIGEGRRIKKLLTPCVDLFIAVSKATAEDQLKNNPSTRRLVKVYEGIDLDMSISQTDGLKKKKEFGIPATAKVVGNISRFVRGKGQKELLEAAALVVKRHNDVVFLMVGEGELMSELQAKTKQLNLVDHVIFTGWRKDIAEILSIIDIFVHCPTTWIEGMGIANLEAMGMGKPCVVSDNGGLPDVVLHGVNGFVVPPGDAAKIADAVLKLLKDQELAVRFGRNAKKRIEDEFDIKKNTKKLEVYLEEYVRSASFSF